jgi:hypothetical protein
LTTLSVLSDQQGLGSSFLQINLGKFRFGGIIAAYEMDDDSFEEFVKFKKALNTGLSAEMGQGAGQIEENSPKEEAPAKRKEKVDPLKAKADFELKFALEMWYEQHKDDTAATEFVEIDAEEVNLLLSFFGKKKEYNEERLDALKKRLDAAITGSFGDDGCFVKLHTRSPKGTLFCFFK